MNNSDTCLSPSCATTPETRAVTPAYDVREQDGQILLQVALPGVRKEDLTITAEGQILTLAAERRNAIPDGWTERRPATLPDRYQLRIRLSPAFDPRQAAATHENGVLVVRIDAREEAQPRQIAVS